MQQENTDIEEIFNNTHAESQSDTERQNLEEDNSEDTEDYKTKYEEAIAKANKLEEIARNQKIRAEKAEREAKSPSTQRAETSKNASLSPEDLVSIVKAGIEPEDLHDVTDYAKFKGISVAEALKSSIVKATLAEKSEFRKTAEASNTGFARRGSAKISDSALIENARKGVFPDSEEDLKRLINLRRQK